MPKLAKNLVISPVGRDISCIKMWIKGKRDFDLMLVGYEKESECFSGYAEYYFQSSGFKLEIIKKAVEFYSDTVKKYDAIWLPDDDLSISTRKINQLFYLFRKYDLNLAQPAVKNNYCDWFIAREHPLYKIRYVNVVEMMAPIFTCKVLFDLLYTFDLTRSGWGVSRIWAERLRCEKMAILDDVGIIHTKLRSEAGDYYQKLKAVGINAQQERKDLLEKHNITANFLETENQLKLWARLIPLPALIKKINSCLMRMNAIFYRIRSL